MATASTEATCVFRKPAAADTAARYWGGANAIAWRRGEFFQQRALSPVEKQTQLDVQRESAMRSRADIELNHAGIEAAAFGIGLAEDRDAWLVAHLFGVALGLLAAYPRQCEAVPMFRNSGLRGAAAAARSGDPQRACR